MNMSHDLLAFLNSLDLNTVFAQEGWREQLASNPVITKHPEYLNQLDELYTLYTKNKSQDPEDPQISINSNIPDSLKQVFNPEQDYEQTKALVRKNLQNPYQPGDLTAQKQV